MANSGLAQTPNSSIKSWVELCDEEFSSSSEVEENVNENIKAENSVQEDVLVKTEIKQEPVDSTQTKLCNEVISKKIINEQIKTCLIEVKKEPDDDQDENTPTKICTKVVNNETVSEIKIKTEKDESPWRFSYATILKNSANSENISPTTPGKIKTEQVESQTLQTLEVTGKSVKREIQLEFLQDDLSLSSHLDVFHMQSPLKLESIDEDMNSPVKHEREMRAKKRLGSPKLSFNESSIPDDVLMPSPQKVTRLSSRRKREAGESPLTCKRSKQSFPRSHHTPKCVVPIEQPTVEIEADEQILMRRQKQIDYGKNTIGYERYCQMVPKDKRHKKHPHTPPKQVKYSRRAWDGLIRQWRQQLHFWDPPSEGGGNIDDLDFSSMSEGSSDTTSQASSLPPTPKEENKRRRFSHSRSQITRSSASESSIVADDTGCSPL